jgi:hypothetical protein
VARPIQLNIRLDAKERERATRVAAHYGKNDGEVIRHLLWQADMGIAAGAKPPIVAPDLYACERLGVTTAELERLIDAGYLSEPPTREEVDDWAADETRRTARSVSRPPRRKD